MTTPLKIIESDFFFDPQAKGESALPLASRMIGACRKFPPGVILLVSSPPLSVNIADSTPERLISLVTPEKINLAAGLIDVMAALGTEIRRGDYFLDTLMTETAKLPPFAPLGQHQFTVFDHLRKKGCRFYDLSENREEARENLVKLSHELGISLEYLLGNLEKVIRLVTLLGVRASTINLTNLFHNFQSGFLRLAVTEGKKIVAKSLLSRGKDLEGYGVAVEIFKKGEFNRRLPSLAIEEVKEAIRETEENYDVATGTFGRFIDAVFAGEEERLASAPTLSIRELLSAFKFSKAEREAVRDRNATGGDDPLRWRQTEVGQALVFLREKLNWLSVSVGIKAAGSLDDYRKNTELGVRIQKLKELAGGFSITLPSGRDQKKSESKVSALSPQEILFDLYCLAVLEKRGLPEVVETAIGILEFIQKLENHEPIVDLQALVSARLAGEAYVTLLGTQGLVLRNAPIVNVLERLKSLSGKVDLFLKLPEGKPLSIKEMTTDEFRRAVILLGRSLRTPHSPERILSIINDKIFTEIIKLPAQVIAQGPHDLGRIVELALAGIPPRYPLRRPWKKLNLDRLISMGNCLEPGIRNCLGCPVNTLYGMVVKTAATAGFGEIITYEATGCFEVYSGIWPYTGKKYPSLHGVFGGVPSEMLGGLAAKRARAKFASKTGSAISPLRTLHLGWGGDGATFDIGFGNLSGLFSRLQKLSPDEWDSRLSQRALYVCYDNEGYQNTGNQYSAATSPGGDTTTNPRGKEKPMGNDLTKKPLVEIVADHGVSLSARMNIHRPEQMARVVARALEDGDRGSFLHFLQPCTTGWKFAADNLTYELAHLSEEGGLFSPVTIEYGVPYLEIYPVPRNPGEAFLKLQARFKHLTGATPIAKENLSRVIRYYHEEWLRNLRLTGFDGEIPDAHRLTYLEEEHRHPRVS